MAAVLYALLLLPALAAIGYAVVRVGRRVRIVEEAAPGADNPFEELDTLLASLERETLDGRDAGELEALADELERTARLLERVG